jgi:hypothetical protein
MSNFVEFQVYVDQKLGMGPGGKIQVNPDHVTQIDDFGDHCGIEKDNGKTVDVCGTAAEAAARLKGGN